MYLVVNVENLCLYESPSIDDQGSDVQLPSIEYFSPEFLDELIQFLTKGQEHPRGEVLTTFELGSKAVRETRQNRWRLER